MTITWNRIVDLLSIAAVYDQRTVGEEDVKAWLLVAEIERWPFAAARRAIAEHYAHDAARPRVAPSAISDRLRRLRNRAAESFDAPRIPDGLANHEYPTWFRGRLAEHVNRLVDHWAETGEEPSPAAIEAADIRSLSELVAAAPEHVRSQMTDAVKRMEGRQP